MWVAPAWRAKRKFSRVSMCRYSPRPSFMGQGAGCARVEERRTKVRSTVEHGQGSERTALDPLARDHLDPGAGRNAKIAVGDAPRQQFHRPGAHEVLVLLQPGETGTLDEM